MYAARSRHPGGVNVAMGDGSVRFVKDSVNLQVWRMMSTTAGAEVIAVRSATDPEPGESPTMPTSAIDRIGPTREPRRWPVMRQNWRELLFLHWPIPPEELRPLVPPQLELDLFDGTAYVGLVPFTMTGVRPVGLPPVRGLSSFHETNVRTYVHRDGRDPGVWFFSLDAANRVAVALARSLYHLPYYHARMFLEREAASRPDDPRPILYAGVRRRPDPRPASYLIRATPDRTGPVRPGPVRSNTSSSSATSSMPWRTTASTGARCTITPTRCNRRRSSPSTSRSSRPPASAGPIGPRWGTSPGAWTSRSTQSNPPRDDRPAHSSSRGCTDRRPSIDPPSRFPPDLRRHDFPTRRASGPIRMEPGPAPPHGRDSIIGLPNPTSSSSIRSGRTMPREATKHQPRYMPVS